MRFSRLCLLFFAPAFAASLPSPPHIETPRSGAVLRTDYVAISGSSHVSGTLDVLLGSQIAATVPADSNGRFALLLRLPPGGYDLRVRPSAEPSLASQPIRFRTQAPPPPSCPAHYENLQPADIVLVHTRDSNQSQLYSPTYTHAALYLGPRADGVPLIAEAVTGEQAASNDPVGAVPLSESLGWRNADRVAIFRPNPPLTPAERARAIAWTRETTARGLPFWSVTEDFGLLFRVWLMWDPRLDAPRDPRGFEHVLEALRARKLALDRFDCATLVWRAYWEATHGRVDLSVPNRVAFGGVGATMSARFLARLRPNFLLPDTFALNGKLEPVD